MNPWQKKYGPWALVTGASDGIGREIARSIASRGLSVVAVARRTNVLEELRRELTALGAPDVRVVAADLSQPGGVTQVVAATASLDVGLVVLAAGYGTSGDFVDADVDEELAMIDVNCRAVTAIAHASSKRMLSRRSGGIVFMSSLLAFQGVPRAANYAATKAYVQTFAEGLARELLPRGIDVLASAPGPVHSGFASRASMTMAFALRPDQVARATLDALGRRGTVRPGWLSWMLEAALALLPRWGRVRIMALVMGGMTAAARPASATTR